MEPLKKNKTGWKELLLPLKFVLFYIVMVHIYKYQQGTILHCIRNEFHQLFSVYERKFKCKIKIENKFKRRWWLKMLDKCCKEIQKMMNI